MYFAGHPAGPAELDDAMPIPRSSSPDVSSTGADHRVPNLPMERTCFVMTTYSRPRSGQPRQLKPHSGWPVALILAVLLLGGCSKTDIGETIADPDTSHNTPTPPESSAPNTAPSVTASPPSSNGRTIVYEVFSDSTPSVSDLLRRELRSATGSIDHSAVDPSTNHQRIDLPAHRARRTDRGHRGHVPNHRRRRASIRAGREGKVRIGLLRSQRLLSPLLPSTDIRSTQGIRGPGRADYSMVRPAAALRKPASMSTGKSTQIGRISRPRTTVPSNATVATEH